MIRLKRISGFAPESQKGFAPLVRAMLAALRTGLSHSHFPPQFASRLFELVIESLEAEARARRASLEEMHADILYACMVRALKELSKTARYLRRGSLSCEPKVIPVAVQPDKALHFWLRDDFPGLRKQRKDAASVVMLLEAAKTESNRKPGAMIGNPADPAWLTPKEHAVEEILQMVASGTLSFDESNEQATAVRALLGLWRSQPGEHLFAVMVAKEIATLCDEDECYGAPTLFDAREYERFRAWPPAGQPNANIGRTYHLNPAVRSRHPDGDHGAPEFVRLPLSFGMASDFLYIGMVKKKDYDEDPDSHRTFARDVSGGSSYDQLIDDIAALLPPVAHGP
jgi:hypothetical protein